MRFKEFAKRAGKGVADLLGFHKNSKYVNNYISDTNIRSSIYMSAVIVVLEIWLIIRQTVDEVIPQWAAGMPKPEGSSGWLMYWTSQYWLFMLCGLAVGVFAFTYHRKTFSRKKRFIVNLVFGVLAFLFCIQGFFESYSNREGIRYVLSNSLLVTLYVTAAVLAGTIIVASIFEFKNDHRSRVWNIVIMFLFAAMLFTFGVKVSYSDYTSSNHKEIICFLTMVLYGACMLIWRPYVSILLNVALFLGFYFLINGATISVPSAYRGDELAGDAYVFGALFKDGDLVNYITFLVSLTMVCISIYHQRRNEAIKDEELEYLANNDELTHLYNFQHLVRMVDEDNNREGRVLLFINIANFKTYNDQRGFEKGNEYLKSVGRVLVNLFGDDSICCRQNDDHFVVYTSLDGCEDKIHEADHRVSHIDPEIPLHIRVGIFSIRNDSDARHAVDRARFACSTLGHDLNHSIREFDEEMDEGYRVMQHVIHNIDTAVQEEWVRPFYQPVVWSRDGTLCGCEALARWIDPQLGFLPPGKFVPTLESTRLVHKLDERILESVCRDIRRCLDRKLPIVPISINFSRLDFELMDVVDVLEKYVAQYRVPKDYLHVEITESALADDEGLLSRCVRELKKRGYALWLDDFGSGYSSLNVLKDFDFDVMKIDMKFLSGFERNPKSQPLLESVISMAERMGMRTLTEGVETVGEKDFLTRANCERLQGYLFGKAISMEELQKRIASGELSVSRRLI